MGQLVTLVGSQACDLLLPKPRVKGGASRLVLWAAGSSFSSLHLGGEGRLRYTKNKLKDVGISLPQFLNVLVYFCIGQRSFKESGVCPPGMSLPLNPVSLLNQGVGKVKELPLFPEQLPCFTLA